MTLHSRHTTLTVRLCFGGRHKRHGNHHARIKIHPASAGLTHPSPGTPPETSSVEDSVLWGDAVHNRPPNRTLATDGFSLTCIPSRGTRCSVLSQPLSIPPSRRMDNITACTRWSISCTRLPAASGPIWPLVPVILNGDMVDRGIHQARTTVHTAHRSHTQRASAARVRGIMASGPASPIQSRPFCKGKVRGRIHNTVAVRTQVCRGIHAAFCIGHRPAQPVTNAAEKSSRTGHTVCRRLNSVDNRGIHKNF